MRWKSVPLAARNRYAVKVTAAPRTDRGKFVAQWSPVPQHRRPSWAAHHRPLLLVGLRCVLCPNLAHYLRPLLVGLLDVLIALLNAGCGLADVHLCWHGKERAGGEDHRLVADINTRQVFLRNARPVAGGRALGQAFFGGALRKEVFEGAVQRILRMTRVAEIAQKRAARVSRGNDGRCGYRSPLIALVTPLQAVVSAFCGHARHP